MLEVGGDRLAGDRPAPRRSAGWTAPGRAGPAPRPPARSAPVAGRSERGTRWPAAARTASTASPSSRPARTSSRSDAGRLRRPQRRPVRPGLPQRVVDVGGGQHPRRPWAAPPAQAVRVAGAVEPLVVLRRAPDHRGRAAAPGRASARSGRGGSAPAPAGPASRASARPRRRWGRRSCRGRAATPARRTRTASAVGQAERGRGVGGEVGDGAGVPEPAGRLEVGEVGEGLQRAVEVGRRRARAPSRGSSAMTSSHAWTSSMPARIVRRAGRRKQSTSAGSNCVPRRSPGDLERGVDTAGGVESLDVVGEVDQAHRRRQVLAADLAGDAAAVPPLEGLQQRPAHVVAQLEPVGQLAGRPGSAPASPAAPSGRPCARNRPTMPDAAQR